MKDGESGERDYKVIVRVKDFKKYQELRNRPDTWSKRKAQLGETNPNMMPLGKRNSGHMMGKGEICLVSDEPAWAQWEPANRADTLANWSVSIRDGVNDVMDMVKEFEGVRGDSQYEEIIKYSQQYKDMLRMVQGDFKVSGEQQERELVVRLLAELDMAERNMFEKVEGEDRDMKEITRLMAELEEEMGRYFHDRDTKTYSYVKK